MAKQEKPEKEIKEDKQELKDGEKERIISNYKQLIESIKKYARIKGLSDVSIRALEINHLEAFNIDNCMFFIKREYEKPKSADELLTMILKDGVNNNVIKEIDKYFKSKI